jgi:hypothetical protein
MKAPLKAALILSLLPLMAGASFAGNGKGNGVGNGGCPPGLAKKNPPCVPPGLAKPKEGDYVHDYDYRRITDYDRYRLEPQYSYYRVGEMIYRADPTTFQILEIIGLMDELLR